MKRTFRKRRAASKPQSTYRGRVEIGGVYLSSQLELTLQFTTILYVMVDIVKGVGLPTPPPSPG